MFSNQIKWIFLSLYAWIYLHRMQYVNCVGILHLKYSYLCLYVQLVRRAKDNQIYKLKEGTSKDSTLQERITKDNTTEDNGLMESHCSGKCTYLCCLSVFFFFRFISICTHTVIITWAVISWGLFLWRGFPRR